MSVAKENKRVMVTLDPTTIKLINNIIQASNGAIRTTSEVVKFSVLIAYEALATYNEDDNTKEEN